LLACFDGPERAGARGSPAGTDAGATRHRRRLVARSQHPPTSPDTTLSVGLKNATALSRTQKHRSGGTVKLRLRKGTKTVAKGTAAVSKGCTYKKTITIRSTRRTGTKKGKLKVAATFGGHTYLKSSKRSTTVRFF